MKNTKHFTNNLAAKVTLVITILATACSSLGGFSRGKAIEAIEQDKRYPAPTTMTIDVGGRLTNAGGNTGQTSKDDTAEAAAVRAKEDFMLRQPQIIVAEQLGYIKLYFEKPRLGGKQMGTPGYRLGLGVWNFHVRAEITDKGKELWQDLKLAENDEALPLAVRQTPEITGIIDERETIKRVEFTYKWMPTELGEAFDPNSSAFAKLPQNLQESLKKIQRNTFGGGSNNIADFNTPRKGVVHFQKFDDGWRIFQLAL